MSRAQSRIKTHTLAQFRYCLIPRAAVPQRHAKVVVSVTRTRPELDCALQMIDRKFKLSLLPKNEAQENMRLGIFLIRLNER